MHATCEKPRQPTKIYLEASSPILTTAEPLLLKRADEQQHAPIFALLSALFREIIDYTLSKNITQKKKPKMVRIPSSLIR
jgi:hypothetical protein